MMMITIVTTTTGTTKPGDPPDFDGWLTSSSTSSGEEKLPGDTLVTAWICHMNVSYIHNTVQVITCKLHMHMDTMIIKI